MRNFTFLTAGQPLADNQLLQNYKLLDADYTLRAHPRIRRIVFRIRDASSALYYLHWSDGSDLRVIDQLAAYGCALDEELGGAVVGETGITQCSECWMLYNTLDLEIVATNLIFDADAPERLEEHTYVKYCPECGTRWRKNPLEILGTGKVSNFQ